MSNGTSAFESGSLVRARGREWVVLTESEDLLKLRPLRGLDQTEVGIYLPLEDDDVQSADFPLPDPAALGNPATARLLVDAARFNLRAGAAPFRCLGQIDVAPRAYQFVPLVMALRQDPVRLLIADDAGVGKTIEAGLIARELLDRGIVRRIGVVCPAHLCDQWAAELQDKFGIAAKVVQPAQLAQLERDLPRSDQSVYEYYPHIIVSIDFVKSERHAPMFLRDAPDLIIVDEAHWVARPKGATPADHQRHRLLRALADDPKRHLLLVSATPHSGFQEQFRSLLGLLNKDFDGGADGTAPRRFNRRSLRPYLIQRRRPDIVDWLGEATPFPERVASDRPYLLSNEYAQLYADVWAYCRKSVTADEGGPARQRVRRWAALSLLRSILSSPGAAVGVLGNRRRRVLDESIAPASIEEIDERYGAQVLDSSDQESFADVLPTAALEATDALLDETEQRALGRLMVQARRLKGPKLDAKLTTLFEVVDELLEAEYHPIVFCRFIDTAEYVAAELTKRFKRTQQSVRVNVVTGSVGDDQRRERIAELAESPQRILVSTDCLSEGINLQQDFNAVVHYDLPWNPNRLEQREGRIDRFGQPRPEVRTVTMHGTNNVVDQTVLKTLVRKAQQIRQDLGISVPVPEAGESLVETLVGTILLDSAATGTQMGLALNDPAVSRLHADWDASAKRGEDDRAYFAEGPIDADEMRAQLLRVEPILGSRDELERFVHAAATHFGGALTPRASGAFTLDLGRVAPVLQNAGTESSPFSVAFDYGREAEATILTRTHPAVDALARAVWDAAFSERAEGVPRCGAVRSAAVQRPTIVAVLRLRYLLQDVSDRFAEEIVVRGFHSERGLHPTAAAADELLAILATGVPLPEEEAHEAVRSAVELLTGTPDWFESIVADRVDALIDADDALRVGKGRALQVHPHTPPDVVGCFVVLPEVGR